MGKNESKLAKQWIANLKQQAIEKNQPIRVIRVMPSAMQERGLSDYLICYKGRFIAIEFKAGKGILTDYQFQFLEDIQNAGGIGVVIKLEKSSFVIIDQVGPTGPYYEGNELLILGRLA